MPTLHCVSQRPVHPSFGRVELKMTGKNCQNYTIKEEMHGQLCKNRGKNTGSCLILDKTVHAYVYTHTPHGTIPHALMSLDDIQGLAVLKFCPLCVIYLLCFIPVLT